MNKTYPEYVDLSLFNFPSRIAPNILLNLDIGIPVELEPGLRVVRRLDSRAVSERIRFYYAKAGGIVDHNPYGPSVLFDTGSMNYSIKGKLHRLDGPSFIYLNSYSRNRVELYYVNDVSYPSELEYWIAVEKYKEEHSNE